MIAAEIRLRADGRYVVISRRVLVAAEARRWAREHGLADYWIVARRERARRTRVSP